ncbi:MAG TPA: hypothetical protein VKS21_04930 [Spirochaetota bacterium]|nr:hypothetical protein [Spirochaetota bacterium]
MGRIYIFLMFILLLSLSGGEPFTNFNIKNKYLEYGKHSNTISNIFNKHTIPRHVKFRYPIADLNIFRSLFSDLEYAVDMAVKLAGKKYAIYRTNDYYKAFDGHATYADIHPVLYDPPQNHYIYLCRGIYKGWIDIKGKMIIDISFHKKKSFIYFNIDAYIQVNTMTSFVSFFRKWLSPFEKKINSLIAYAISDITVTGKKVARLLYKKKHGYDPLKRYRRLLRKEKNKRKK